MKKTILSILFLVVSVLAANAKVEFSGNYITEGQTALRNAIYKEGKWAGWINKLELDLRVPLWKGANFNASSMSIYGTIGDDNNIYPEFHQHSNIAAANRIFSFYRLGLYQDIGPVRIFAGLGNVNEYFFATPYADFFTGCNECIMPTALNLFLADYPCAQLCLNVKWNIWDRLNFIAYAASNYAEDVVNPDNMFQIDFSKQFRLNFPQDGWAAISEINWENDKEDGLKGSYHLGFTLGQEGWSESGKSVLSPVLGSLFAYIEQPVWKKEQHLLGIAAQASVAFGEPSRQLDYCQRYFGLGLYYNFNHKHEAGFFLNYGHYFMTAYELDLEFSYRWRCLDWLYLQAAMRDFSALRPGDSSRHWSPSLLLRLGFLF